MTKTMLTCRTLDRFEERNHTEQYTEKEINTIEMAAYIANMNSSTHSEWTEEDIYNEFVRILGVDHIELDPIEEETEPSAAETVEAITEAVKAEKTRSAWSKGVKAYALELLEKLAEDAEGGYVEHWELTRPDKLEKAMLNGAADWVQYSEGGCALIYDGDIAERLCNASELRKTDNGRKNPNPRESWIQCQSRALYQAAVLIKSCAACVVEG